MVAQSELYIEEELIQVEAVFRFGLYASGTIRPVVGPYQQRFAFAVGFARQYVEVTDVCFRIDEHIGNRPLLFRGDSRPYVIQFVPVAVEAVVICVGGYFQFVGEVEQVSGYPLPVRSEERRVGKECRSRWSPYH